MRSFDLSMRIRANRASDGQIGPVGIGVFPTLAATSEYHKRGVDAMRGLLADFRHFLVGRLANTVDPAERERRIHRLGPGQTGPARVLLVKAHPELARRRVVRREPGAKLFPRRKEDRR
jgi:hypothetical protein